jgi:uncharacterized membrane protein YcjF (UPF0283 family)
MKISEIKKGIVDLEKEAERLYSRRIEAQSNSDKHLSEVRSSIDTFWFLIFGSFFGLVINLIANIIHDQFSKSGYLYYSAVFIFLIISFYLIINFLARKFERIKRQDNLIRELANGNKDPGNYIASINKINERIKVLKGQLEEFRSTI